MRRRRSATRFPRRSRSKSSVCSRFSARFGRGNPLLLMDIERLLPAVHSRATGMDSPIHGERHWQCVTHTGNDLAREVPGADGVVVFLFGLLHDTMRENDGYDPEHGVRAVALARDL